MDDEKEWTPSIFANKVILQLVQHALAEGTMIEPKDYLVIRAAFRSAGGSWGRLAEGDMVMFELLQKLVTAWGKLPGRKNEGEILV